MSLNKKPLVKKIGTMYGLNKEKCDVGGLHQITTVAGNQDLWK